MKPSCTLFSNLILLLILVSTGNIFAQDTLYKTTKEQIVCKVQEIGINEIKYKDFNNLNGPVIVIRKAEVWKIRYENGTELLVTQDVYSLNQEEKIRNKSRAIKFEFFSPLAHNLGFGYERMLKVGLNLEIKIGIIGPGFSPSPNDARGAYFKGGVKFLMSPPVVMDGMHYSHQLKGFYIKPELIFNSYTENSYNYNYYYNGYPTPSRVTITNYAFDLVFGKQYILGNIMTLDLYAGVGYGYQHASNTINTPYESGTYYESANYSHLYNGPSTPLILSGGMSLGVLF